MQEPQEELALPEDMQLDGGDVAPEEEAGHPEEPEAAPAAEERAGEQSRPEAEDALEAEEKPEEAGTDGQQPMEEDGKGPEGEGQEDQEQDEQEEHDVGGGNAEATGEDAEDSLEPAGTLFKILDRVLMQL